VIVRNNLLISCGLLLLAYAAFDDIMTDNDTDFSQEYFMLVVCAAWFTWLGVRALLQRRRPA